MSPRPMEVDRLGWPTSRRTRTLRQGSDRFAFSPDRRYLAFGKGNAPDAGETLDILSADGATTGIFSWGGHPPGTPFVGGLKFAWAPDSSRLAVYPGAADGEVAIVGVDGGPTGVLRLPSGASFSTAHGQFFAGASWSPDSTWLAAAVRSGGDVSPCAAGDDAYLTCYILLATDGSLAEAASDDPSGYLAWAPDSRLAVTHYDPGTVEIRPTNGSASRVIALPPSVKPGDGHVLAWSPDGTRLAVAASPDATGNTLLVINEDGTVHPALIAGHFTGNGSNIWDIAWSMDEQRLLFSGAPSDGSPGIWSIDVGGGSPTLLLDSVDGTFDIADGRS